METSHLVEQLLFQNSNSNQEFLGNVYCINMLVRRRIPG
jgi:hypothetical protein